MRADVPYPKTPARVGITCTTSASKMSWASSTTSGRSTTPPQRRYIDVTAPTDIQRLKRPYSEQRRFLRVSEPHEPLPESPSGLTAKVKELLSQSRQYQMGMVRIQTELERLQVRIAMLAPKTDPDANPSE